MNSPRLQRLIVPVAFTFLVGPGATLGAEVSSVRASVSVDQFGEPQITECDTNRLISLGPKTSNAYVKFAQIYADETRDWTGNVVVEVEGELLKSRGPNGERLFNNPMVWRYRHGACESTPRKANDPKTLTQLLSDLQTKLSHYRSTPDSNLPYNDESDLKILIGASKKRIQAGLGDPDYCESRRNCLRSESWAYIFFHRVPLSFGGGCCALEIEFNAKGQVSFVKWQAQR